MRKLSLLLPVVAIVALTSCKTREFNNEASTKAALRPTTDCEAATGSKKTNPAHCEGDMFYAGEFEIDATALQTYYKGVAPAHFGSLALIGPDGKQIVSRATGRPKYIRDLQYPVGNKKIGMRIIPVADRPGGTGWANQAQQDKDGLYPIVKKTADGHDVKGAELLDAQLRKSMGLTDPNAPIFAFIYYLHPEIHQMPISEVGKPSYLRTENGITHVGAYLGNGRTRNSPFNYHGMKIFEESGYPASLATVSLKGVDQATLNQNFLITTVLLNEMNGGPKFPSDYKKDFYRNISMEESLAFFRGWMDPTWTRPGTSKPYMELLKNSLSYYTYCAEHITLITNVALNLPQNEVGYKAVFGNDAGYKMWNIAKQNYKKITGENMPVVAEFNPLWKLEKPIIDDLTKIKKPGKAMGWRAQKTADLLVNFVEQYAAYPDVGPVFSTAAVVGFANEVKSRLGVEPTEYLQKIMPIVNSMFRFDAQTYPLKNAPSPEAAFDEMVAKYTGGLKQVFAGNSGLAPLTEQIVGSVENTLKAKKAIIIQNSGKSVADSWKGFLNDTKKAYVTLINMKPPNVPGQNSIEEEPTFITHYSPPAVFQRMALGLYEHNSNISFDVVATAVRPEEVSRHGKSEKVYDLYTGQPK